MSEHCALDVEAMLKIIFVVDLIGRADIELSHRKSFWKDLSEKASLSEIQIDKKA